MDISWLKRTIIKAHLDRLRFVVEPINATPRSHVAANIPHTPRPGEPHADKVTARWELREVGDTGKLFEVTVHDPVSIPAIMAIVDRMKLRLPLARDPMLTLLEVALDVWPKQPGTIDLERVVADLFKGAKFEPSDNSRAGGGPLRATSLFGPDTPYRRLHEGYSLYNGNVSDPVMVRAYVKRTDNRALLPSDQQRARFELELKGDGLPVPTVRALRSYRFESMSPMFLMRTVREDLPPLAAFVAHAVPKLRRYPRTMRKARMLTDRAFTEFNKRAYRALERLTRAMQNESRSPFRPDHLHILADRSVTTDSFFHPTVDVTPPGQSSKGVAPLTTLSIGEQDDQIDARDAA